MWPESVCCVVEPVWYRYGLSYFRRLLLAMPGDGVKRIGMEWKGAGI